MKLFALLLIFLIIAVEPAFAQVLDTPGLRQEFFVETGGYEFMVETTSNYNIEEVELSVEEKKLTFYINSGLQNNLGEIVIPVNLINGNFTFFLNDQEFFPKVKISETISFITVEFEGDGRHKLEVIGTTYLPEFSEIASLVLATSLLGILFVNKKKFSNFGKLFFKQ